MPNSPLNAVLHQLRTASERSGAGSTDGELLTRFLSDRDEDALAALVKRHAPMVWGVCRRVLRNDHDAEDAFQATFLVLVRKATTVSPREMVANWLYGVAHQTAVRQRVTAAKRSVREMQMKQMPEPAVAEARVSEFLPLLDQELSRLPEQSRVLIVLCDLEGKTRKEAARQLGCPEGTVASRLARARNLLAKRMARHGLAVSGGSLMATLSQSVASANVPNAVVSNTIHVATLLAANQAVGAISGSVAALTEGVLKTMLLKKIMTTTMVVLALGMAVIGGGTLALGQSEGTGKPVAGKEAKQPAAEKPMIPAAKQEKEPFTAWGKEVGGLQAGLGFKGGEKRAYHTGETVAVVLRVRNVGKEQVKLSYYHAEFRENPPVVTDDGGQRVPLKGGPFLRGEPERIDVTLAPGKTVDLTEGNLVLRPAGEKGQGTPAWTLFGAGMYQLHCDKAGGSIREQGGPDPILSNLATGKLELEVKEPEKGPQNKKEAFTAWGKEVGGLQAGLGFKAGEKRAYRHSETVNLVVRVRNVGKEEITFQYLRHFFIENPPAVTDDAGKAVVLKDGSPKGIYQPADVTLAPGKETELYELSLELSNNVIGIPKDSTLAGTGKFRLQYERVLGNSLLSSVSIKFDPALSKLATGKLELEVQDDLTAWGKEVGGLQAGLGFPLGAKRVYSHGETVKLVLRLRNTGKEEVEFKHIWAYFVENPPTITDADGKLVQMPRPLAEGLQRPRNPKVAPGKEIELYELSINVLPKGETSKTNKTIHGTGKFSVQYERIVGPTSGNREDPNPAMSKLATGKLELEVKEPDKAPADPKAKQPEGEKLPPKDLAKIQPPGGVPLSLVKPGTNEIGVEELNKVRMRLEAVPNEDLEKWVVELERIMDAKLKDGLPSARQTCRTDFATRLSVAFDDLKWNATSADNLFKRAQALPTSEAKAWKQAFESVLKTEIGQTETTNFAGGPAWAVPLVLIPVDALHEGQKYSVERGKKYRDRLKQLTKEDVSLWKDKVDEFGGTKLDAAVNIILLDEYFDKERFKWESFRAAIETRKK